MLSPLRTWRGALAPYLREDPLLARLALLYALTQLASIGWDLPCSYGWENDGVAPRDLFGGLAFNLTPGDGHRYPLFHYALLALLVWPVLLVAALRARSLQLPDLMESVLSAPVLTSIALIAKLVSVAMSCMLLLVLARLARRTLSRAAGRWAFGLGALNVSLAYYGRVSNLDGPYLMWVALSLDRSLDVCERAEWRDYRACALCAAAALATKDQAYSLYALSAPLYAGLALWRARRAGSQPFAYRNAARALLVATLSYGVFSAALVNPTGFAHRVRLLTGENSQDWRRYAFSVAGAWANLGDLARAQAQFFWPWPVVCAAWAGVLVALAMPSGSGVQRRSLRMLPLVCAVSSLFSFALVVGRAEHRFALPLGFALSYYAGAAAAWSRRRLVGGALLLVAAGPALALHLTQWRDARREVESWLAALPAGSRVETYGLGVYLPRFDTSAYRVQRVAPDSANAHRPHIPGIQEIEDAYGHVATRAPDVLVIPEAFASRFLPDAAHSDAIQGARIVSNVLRASQRDRDAQAFFEAALHDRLRGYRVRLIAQVHLPRWAAALGLSPVHIHGSTAAKTWLLDKSSR